MAHDKRPVEIRLAEHQMCTNLIELAKAYFAGPKNQARFEAWQKEQKKKVKKGEKDEP